MNGAHAHMIKHVLFDLDDALCDFATARERSWTTRSHSCRRRHAPRRLTTGDELSLSSTSTSASGSIW